MAPLVIAHRGDSAHAPENTLRSVRQALDKHADWIEVDLQLTGDDQVVLFHDDEMYRLTGQVGLLRNQPLSELSSLRVNETMHEPGDDTAIPTLGELIKEVADDASLYLELKSNGEGRSNARNARLLENCLRAIEGTRHAVASFDLDLVRGALLAKNRAILIVDEIETIDECTPAELRHLTAVSLRRHLIDPELIEALHALGAQVWTWTVDDPRDMVELVAMGVDGICTNDVAVACEALDE